MKKILVKSVNISNKEGTKKTPTKTIALNSKGVEGEGYRQLSLLSVESYENAKVISGVMPDYGAFSEDLTTEGLPLHHTKVFDHFICGNVDLEVTQVGQKSYGDCEMPKEVVFCRVIKGGELRPGDVFEYISRQIKVHIITLSDRAYKGIYEDKSGPFAEDKLKTFFQENNRHYHFQRTILPDDKKQIEELMLESKNKYFDIVITTGGTGIGPRDNTPDVVKPMLDKEISGIMELIRVKYGQVVPNALLSRSIAGVMGKTLVYVLPGSVKAVDEYLTEITKTIEHSLRMLHAIDSH